MLTVNKELLIWTMVLSATLMLFITACSEEDCLGACVGNSECDKDSGECICLPGWYGDNCDNQDLCVEVECTGNAVCLDGICECTTGYEGETCEVLWTNKMLGEWTQVDECGEVFFASSVVITTGSELTSIVITNFSGLLQDPADITASMISSTSWELPAQSIDGFDIEGSTIGSYDFFDATGDEALTIQHNINGQICKAVFTR